MSVYNFLFDFSRQTKNNNSNFNSKNVDNLQQHPKILNKNVDIYICIIQLDKLYFPAGENYVRKTFENLEIPQAAQ